jgi:hypothetical protein
MILPRTSAIMSISGAPFAALVVSSTFNLSVANNLDGVPAGSAPGSLRSRTETQGAECAVVASPETARSDVGILVDGCKENEVCVEDNTSSLGGRCIFGLEEGVIKEHRDLASSACSGSYPNDCIPCTMLDGVTAGKKCDGYKACSYVDPAKVSCGSCNGKSACPFAIGPIGESSCNDYKSCYGQSCELNFYSSIKFINLARDRITHYFDIQMRSAAIVGKSSIKDAICYLLHVF